MRNVLRAVLEGDHHVEIIGEACNGEDALQQVRSLEPESVIMDICMPWTACPQLNLGFFRIPS